MFPLASRPDDDPEVIAKRARIEALCVQLAKKATAEEVNKFKCGMHLYNELELHYCVSAKLRQVLSALLQEGFDANQRDEHNMTALHLACKDGDVESVEILLRHGSDMYAKAGSRGRNPIFTLMTYRGYLRSLRGRSVEVLTMDGKDAIFQILKLFFENGYTIDMTTSDGQLEMHDMLTYGPKGIVDLVITHGYDLQTLELKERCVLHSLVETCNYEVLEEALKHIDVDFRHPFEGGTALHRAIHRCDLTSVKLLLEHGADVNIKNKVNTSPLHMAMDRSGTEILKLMLEWKSLSDSVATILDNMNISRHTLEMRHPVIRRHLLNMKAAGLLDVNDRDISVFSRRALSAILEKNRNNIKGHIEEIVEMKKRMLDPKLSAFDALRDTNRLAQHINKPMVKEYFESKSYNDEFPRYSRYLETSYKKAVIRSLTLIGRSEAVLLDLFSSVKLPYSAVKIITADLKTPDLKCLLR